MQKQKKSKNSAWAVSAVLIAVIILFFLFFISQTPEKAEGIVLPDAQDMLQQGSVVDPEIESAPNVEQFLEITDQNVLSALRSLSSPIAYHQVYKVMIGSETSYTVLQVQLWVKGNLLHAEVSDSYQCRNLVSDGETAYIWYDNEKQFVSITLDQDMRVEDLLGIPDFNSHLTLEQNEVVDSGYLILEDAQVPLIYVCAQNNSDRSCRYWINLETGLLYQADVLENSNRIYDIRQELYEALALEDESFHNRFLLPDGRDPFTAEAKMLQP